MADWPDFLPSPLVEAVQYQPQDNMIRTQMEAGAAKQRRRFTSAPEDVSFSLFLTKPQVQVLNDFVTVELKDVLPFNWREFRQPADPSNVAVYRFKSRPVYTPAGSGVNWRADIELELISKPAQGVFPLSEETGAMLTLDDGTELTT